MTKKRKRLACLCCGAHSITRRGAYEVCAVGGWEDDPALAKDHELRGVANRLSLNEAKAEWRAGQD
jgi:hypothetical protein